MILSEIDMVKEREREIERGEKEREARGRL